MRGKQLLAGIVVVASLFSMTGCAPKLTADSIDAMLVGEGGTPELTVELNKTDVGFADSFAIDIDWTEIGDASGYELQRAYDSDWVTQEANKGEVLFTTLSELDVVNAYDELIKYRVRAVFAGAKEVSEWSSTESLRTPRGNLHYEVFGTAKSASVTMSTNSGTQQAKVSLPMTAKSGTIGLWLQATNMTPYISAQAQTSGTVTCRITRKGQIVAENTSSGRFSIATCSPR